MVWRSLAGALFWTAAVGASLTGCSQETLRPVESRFDVFFPASQVRVDRFVQKAAAKVDVLWIIDNSGSMAQEQDNLANNFSHFIDAITAAQVDYHIGVVSTDMTLANHQGRLLGSPKVITAGPNAVQQFAANVHVGTSGAANEEGLAAAAAAVTAPLSTTDNAGFLRDDAALALIFVSDENDSSFGMISYYQRVFEQLKGIGNENHVIAGSIVGDAPTTSNPAGGCTNVVTGTARYGKRYHELVSMVGGVTTSICAEDFSDALTDLGLTAAGLQQRFVLTDPAADPFTLEVKVDGTVIAGGSANGWRFEPGVILFDGGYIPPPGSTIEVSYVNVEKRFVLTREPKVVAERPGEGFEVRIYPAVSGPCATDADCTRGTCGLAGKCDGRDVAYGFADGWVLEAQGDLGAPQFVIAFEGTTRPTQGTTVEVVYACVASCSEP